MNAAPIVFDRMVDTLIRFPLGPKPLTRRDLVLTLAARITKEELEEKLNDGWTYFAIARAYSCNTDRLFDLLVHYGLRGKTRVAAKGKKPNGH